MFSCSVQVRDQCRESRLPDQWGLRREEVRLLERRLLDHLYWQLVVLFYSGGLLDFGATSLRPALKTSTSMTASVPGGFYNHF